MQGEERPARVERVERAGGSKRTTVTLVAAVVGLLLVAAIKPWGAPGAAQAAPPISGTADTAAPAAVAVASSVPAGRRTVSVSTGSPSVRPTPARDECHTLTEWQLLTFERNAQLETRTLLPVTPVEAGGPRDKAIVPRDYQAAALLAIGYCVPIVIHPDFAATEATVVLWQQLPGGRFTALRDVAVLAPVLASVGEVYLAPPSGIRGASWPAGLYEFEVPGAVPGAAHEWFSLAFSIP